MINKLQPLVTIGIPTYNRADSYLGQSLESAVNQTYKNIEIVVSDNCSTDNTEGYVKGFNDPRIRYFKQKVNIGAINNSNYCLDQARGDYFLQLHDDDSIDPDFVEACMSAAMYSCDIGIIRTGARGINADNEILHESRNRASGLSAMEFFRSWFAWKTPVYLCNTLINTKYLKEVGGFKSKHNLFDDVAVYAKLAEYSRVDVEGIKASFRTHDNEETAAVKVKYWCEDSLYLLDLICDVVPSEYKDSVRREGKKFFSEINYQFASSVKPCIKRFFAYCDVFSTFHYRYMPPPLKHFLTRNPLYKALKIVRGRLKTLLMNT